MTVNIQIICDKCGHIVSMDSQFFVNNADMRLGEVPRNLSFFEMPGQSLICFECAAQAVAMPEDTNIRRLKDDEIVRVGDLVTVHDKDDRDGYRPLQGLMGVPAGEYFYPIFRRNNESNVPKPAGPLGGNE